MPLPDQDMSGVPDPLAEMMQRNKHLAQEGFAVAVQARADIDVDGKLAQLGPAFEPVDPAVTAQSQVKTEPRQIKADPFSFPQQAGERITLPGESAAPVIQPFGPGV